MTLEERLAEVMATMNWTRADLMRVTGASPSVVSQWLGKGSKIINSIGNIETANRLAAASGYAAQWLSKGTGPKHTSGPPRTAPHLPTDQLIAELGARLAEAPERTRKVALSILQGLIETPNEAPEIGAEVAALLDAAKRRAA